MDAIRRQAVEENGKLPRRVEALEREARYLRRRRGRTVMGARHQVLHALTTLVLGGMLAWSAFPRVRDLERRVLYLEVEARRLELAVKAECERSGGTWGPSFGTQRRYCHRVVARPMSAQVAGPTPLQARCH